MFGRQNEDDAKELTTAEVKEIKVACIHSDTKMKGNYFIALFNSDVDTPVVLHLGE
jgi:hypothetical protein